MWSTVPGITGTSLHKKGTAHQGAVRRDDRGIAMGNHFVPDHLEMETRQEWLQVFSVMILGGTASNLEGFVDEWVIEG